MVGGSGGDVLVIACQIPSSEEVHTAASAIVQGCVAVSIVFLALAVGSGEVAAPALARLADGLKADDGGDFCPIFYARVCNYLS